MKKDRIEIHRQIASAIEDLNPQGVDEFAPVLARHHRAAGNVDQAVHYLLVAGHRAHGQGARIEASRFFADAQELLEAQSEPDGATLAEAALSRISTAMTFTPFTEMRTWVEKIRPVVEELDDPATLARLYERSVSIRSMHGEPVGNRDFRDEMERADQLAERITDPSALASLEASLGLAFRSQDEYEESLQPLGEAVDAFERAGAHAAASYNASMLADSLSAIGRFDEAVLAIDRATKLGETANDPNSVLDADIIRGSILSERGELAEAREVTLRGIAAAEEMGNTFCDLAGNFKLADQQLRLGNADRAISHLERSTDLAAYCDAGGYEALGKAWLVAARSKIGESSVSDFDEPLAAAIDSNSRSTEGLIRLRRAITLVEIDRSNEASPDFERAIELFADYGGLPNLARAHSAYSHALDGAGRTVEAEWHHQAAEALFAKLGISPDVEELS